MTTNKSIAVIDYGMGNLHSVTKALAVAGGEVTVTADAALIEDADAVVLPGQGHFGEAMKRLTEVGLVEPIAARLTARRPFLGICLGLQVLFETSEESPGVRGFGFFRGRVRRFPATIDGERLTIPSMGWNLVTPTGKAGRALIGEADRYYFVHSYYVESDDPSVMAAETRYGLPYLSAAAAPPVFAVQFHPEKSSTHGLDLLRRWIGMV